MGAADLGWAYKGLPELDLRLSLSSDLLCVLLTFQEPKGYVGHIVLMTKGKSTKGKTAAQRHILKSLFFTCPEHSIGHSQLVEANIGEARK